MTSRPVLLVCLLIILIVTSQFEWKQQLGGDLDATPVVSQKQQTTIKREGIVKEKIIMSQEKTIQRLNELVQTLQKQLQQCQSNTTDPIGNSVDTITDVIDFKRMLED